MDDPPRTGDPPDVEGLTDAGTRAEFSHELYVDATGLDGALADLSPGRALEVGCGFGRLTPWLAARADELWAVDLDGSLLAAARRQHGHRGVRFARAAAERLPFPDGAFDLAATWGVLNHVPDGAIDAAAGELDRVVAADGALVVAEATAGAPDPRWTYRSVDEWRELFAPRELVRRAATERDGEPFRDDRREHVVMTFR